MNIEVRKTSADSFKALKALVKGIASNLLVKDIKAKITKHDNDWLKRLDSFHKNIDKEIEDKLVSMKRNIRRESLIPINRQPSAPVGENLHSAPNEHEIMDNLLGLTSDGKPKGPGGPPSAQTM